MRRNSFSASFLCVLAVFVAGCTQTKGVATLVVASPNTSGPTSDHDAIVTAIQKHLSSNTGLNMSVMDVNIDSVNINGDQAQANAEFHLKQDGTSMMVTYDLERHAGDWIVLGNKPKGGQFVHPPMDKTHSGAGATVSLGRAPTGACIPGATGWK